MSPCVVSEPQTWAKWTARANRYAAYARSSQGPFSWPLFAALTRFCRWRANRLARPSALKES